MLSADRRAQCLARFFKLPLQHRMLVRATDYDLQFRQRRGLAKVIIDAPLHEFHCCRPPLVISHYDYGHAGIAHLIEKAELVLDRAIIRIQVQNQDIKTLFINYSFYCLFA
jgi:hypothetical protein